MDEWLLGCVHWKICSLYHLALIMRLSCTDFKIWILVEDNYKFYVFACFFIVVVVVNIWISLFIKLYNLCFLRNTLRKIPRAVTERHKLEHFGAWGFNIVVAAWGREDTSVVGGFPKFHG